MATLGIPSNTIEILKKYNFNFQKRFGQNFLIDTHILEKIVDEAGIDEDDCVLEIGPGIGTMTQYLCERAGRVIAVEIDKALIPILNDTLSSYNNVTIINEDILKVDITKLCFIVSEIRFFLTSTLSTSTSTTSPMLSASSGCLIYLSVICEICTSPSW